MKTTLDIADNILSRGKAVARRRRSTLRDLVEQGLLLAIEREEAKPPPEVVPVTVGGQGLSPEFAGRGWSAVRDAAYEGRGT